MLRRLASLLYESLLVAAILLAAAVSFYIAAPGVIEGTMRLLMQVYVGAILAAYFLWCWCRSGQTLPMKTWGMRVVDHTGKPPAPARALIRFGIAAISLGASCAGVAVIWKRPHETIGWMLLAPGIVDLAWAWFDRDRQFLHDRLAGTRLRVVPRAAPPATPPSGAPSPEP
jgi:uncharacterized RDD family membrane protein YckC